MKTEIIYVDKAEMEKVILEVMKGHSSLNELMKIIQEESYKEKKILVSKDGNQYQLNCKHINYIESEKEKTKVHTNQKVFISKKRLYELEKELPEEFVRIGKGIILNINQVDYYRPQMNGLMKAVLRNEEVVFISRKYLREIRNKILKDYEKGGKKDEED